MPEPLVVQVMRDHKAALLAQEAVQYQAMAARWLEVERSLEAQISLLARELADAKAAGKAINGRALYRMVHYQELLPQVRRELERYGVYAADEIAQAQGRYAQAGLFDAADAIGAAYQTEGRIGVFYHRLPVSAVENMVGLAGDGSPVKELLKATWPDTVDGITSALIQGTAAGWNPTKTAAAMRDSMASTGLGRAITIARTEQLRAYRQAADMQYRASGVVQYKMRVVSHQAGQTCLACLALEGEIIPIDQDLYDHPRGRCSEIPIPIGTKPPEWVKGEEWFDGLDDATQREMMGPAKYAAWKDGQFTFKEIAGITDDKVWGKSPRVRSVRELTT